MAKQLVTIGGRRKINLVCFGLRPRSCSTGFGSEHPAVGKRWGTLPPQSTLACFYDRVGYGYSDPAGRRSTAANAVQDLARCAAPCRRENPFVGRHSWVGFIQLFTADRYQGRTGSSSRAFLREQDLTRCDRIAKDTDDLQTVVGRNYRVTSRLRQPLTVTLVMLKRFTSADKGDGPWLGGHFTQTANHSRSTASLCGYSHDFRSVCRVVEAASAKVFCGLRERRCRGSYPSLILCFGLSAGSLLLFAPCIRGIGNGATPAAGRTFTRDVVWARAAGVTV